jgi:hypothetical protein
VGVDLPTGAAALARRDLLRISEDPGQGLRWKFAPLAVPPLSLPLRSPATPASQRKHRPLDPVPPFHRPHTSVISFSAFPRYPGLSSPASTRSPRSRVPSTPFPRYIAKFTALYAFPPFSRSAAERSRAKPLIRIFFGLLHSSSSFFPSPFAYRSLAPPFPHSLLCFRSLLPHILRRFLSLIQQ